MRPIFLLFLALPAVAELSLPGFFSDHMVLQRESKAAIWGHADPGKAVTVSFKGKTAKAKANGAGKWRAEIPTGPADATGNVITVVSGKGRVEIADVLVGEVWLASGQSNMAFPLSRSEGAEALLQGIDLPEVRMFDGERAVAETAQNDLAGAWLLPSAESAARMSAVAFFFAKSLHEGLGVPVGILESSWGGKPVETFTSRAALSAHTATKPMIEKLLSEQKTYDPAAADKLYQGRLAGYKTQLAEWQKSGKAKGKRRPKPPAKPKPPLLTEGRPGVLFDAMIYPLAGYTMRGAIWYQGEANAKPGAVPYDITLPLLIKDWRTRWNSDLAFLFVQLANFKTVASEPGNKDPWALLQDRQRRILDQVSNTGMATINDVGDAKDIHPKDKATPGARLARWALAKNYGKPLVHSGPLYRGHEVRGKTVRLRFDAVGDGLKARDGKPLARFEVAGADKVWHWAVARIAKPDTVVVSSKAVPKPLAVRYAWAANPEGANLANSDDLPASIFRTDDWDDVVDKSALEEAAKLAKWRALGLKIRELHAERAQHDPKSPEWKTMTEAIFKIRAQRDAK
jgi:sialate O-acetylesterase